MENIVKFIISFENPPEEALAGAHQGGELEVVRTQNHLLYYHVLH